MQEPVNLLAPSPGLITWTFALLGVVGVLAGVTIFLFVRWLRADATRQAPAVALAPIHASVEALETEVAQLRTDVTHLADGQDFTTQLLARRPVGPSNATPEPKLKP